jgi:glycosyltransferase involved in cell wall biosynthesis
MPPAASGDPVSVVMPVHNALPFLDAAIRSILDQTHSNFEFVILDDASTDGSGERLRYWAEQDPRIRLFESADNLGPVGSSNRVVKHATGALVARMDADDISHPDRLRDQIAFLGSRPDVGMVAALYQIIDGEGCKVRGPDVWRLRPGSLSPPFPHGSIMFRRELFDRIGGYRDECEFWEDQDFALRASSATNILIIPKILYRHRQSTASTRVASNADRVERAVDRMYRCVESLRATGSYEELLDEKSRAERVDPRVFISLGSLTLWSKGRPKLFARLLKRGDIKPNARSLAALAWTAWAEISPGSLRAVLGMLVRIRNRAGGGGLSLEEPIAWSPKISSQSKPD